MKKTRTEVGLICKECGSIVPLCDECDQYFNDDLTIYCDKKNGAHYCRMCYDKIEEVEDEE